MSQILHIFRKDVRRFWIEFLISLIVLAVLTYCEWQFFIRLLSDKSGQIMLATVLLFFAGGSWRRASFRTNH